MSDEGDCAGSEGAPPVVPFPLPPGKVDGWPGASPVRRWLIPLQWEVTGSDVQQVATVPRTAATSSASNPYSRCRPPRMR